MHKRENEEKKSYRFQSSQNQLELVELRYRISGIYPLAGTLGPDWIHLTSTSHILSLSDPEKKMKQEAIMIIITGFS